MSHGIRVWDANGIQLLTITDRITRFIQSTVVFVTGTHVVSVPGLVLDGSWFVYAFSNDAIASFTASVSTNQVTLQRIGSFQNNVNVLVFRA